MKILYDPSAVGWPLRAWFALLDWAGYVESRQSVACWHDVAIAVHDRDDVQLWCLGAYIGDEPLGAHLDRCRPSSFWLRSPGSFDGDAGKALGLSLRKHLSGAIVHGHRGGGACRVPDWDRIQKSGWWRIWP